MRGSSRSSTTVGAAVIGIIFISAHGSPREVASGHLLLGFFEGSGEGISPAHLTGTLSDGRRRPIMDREGSLTPAQFVNEVATAHRERS